jgi:hypothetical protein
MTPAGPGSADRPVPGRLRVAIIAANTFEYESRLLKTAQTLAADGHAVTVIAFAGDGLPNEATLAERVELRRVRLDRRIASGLRPLPGPIRSGILRAAGLAPDAETLPSERPHGADRLRSPVRRGLEILATVRRGGQWAKAVAAMAPDAEVAHAKALIALPVARRAVRRTAGRRGRFVYDVADLHTESARLVKLPAVLRALIRRREGRWVREAAGVLATRAMAVFLGFGHLEGWLRAEAARRPDRMAVLPAVPEAELLDWTAGADVAFVGAPPRTINQRLTLPNKLFQALMAGVPIVVGTGTEHCRLASAEAVGRCCEIDSPASIAAAIAELLALEPPARDALRAHCRTVALDKYSWETTRGGLVGLYRRLAEDDRMTR